MKLFKRIGLSPLKIIILALFMAVAGFAFSIYRSRHSEKETLREVRVERGTIVTSILATGTVQPENRLEMKPPIAGRVEQVLVQEGQKLAKGQTIAWISSSERAAMLDAARAEGPAELARWEKLYRPTPVVAPIRGMLIARNVEAGQTFGTTDIIFVMSDRLTVKAQVDETDISQIHLKQSAEMVLDAYPNNKMAAKVDQIAFDAKTVSNVTTYLVDVLPDKTPEYMRSGMTANVTFLSERHDGVLLVPSDTIKMENGQATVQIPGQGDETISTVIQTGLTDGRRTEVKEGLREGQIIVAPVFALKKKQGGANPFSPMGNRPKNGPGPGK